MTGASQKLRAYYLGNKALIWVEKIKGLFPSE